jgi:hypothetical protein
MKLQKFSYCPRVVDWAGPSFSIHAWEIIQQVGLKVDSWEAWVVDQFEIAIGLRFRRWELDARGR